MILHIVPLEAFSNRNRFSVEQLLERQLDFQPMSTGGWNNRVTLQGLLNFAMPRNGANALTYTHTHRNGIVEAVDAFIVEAREGRNHSLPSVAFEQRIIVAVKQYLDALQKLGVAPPLYVFLTLVGVKGMTMGVGPDHWSTSEPHALEDDVLVIPETVITSYATQYASQLRGMFDMVWNSFGYPKSTNYDAAGNWKPS